MHNPGLNIVADNKVANFRAIEALGKVTFLHSADISPQTIQDADVLVVRTETPINQKLLQDSKVKFIASATIGFDHIDTLYLRKNNIGFANAPGCNAQAVVEYVLAALFNQYSMNQLKQLKLGIIGCGNTGYRLYKLLSKLGIQCFCYDPFKQGQSNVNWVTFNEVIQCDIISLHVPLTHSGKHATRHLINKKILESLTHTQCIINTSRGMVIDNIALLNFKRQNPEFNVVLDVWENEPHINLKLLNLVEIATPHIAGYSMLGKLAATQQVVDKIIDFFNFPKKKTSVFYVEKHVIDVEALSFEQAFLQHFNPDRLSCQMKQNCGNAADFKRLRNQYKLRKEVTEIEWLNINANNQLLKHLA